MKFNKNLTNIDIILDYYYYDLGITYLYNLIEFEHYNIRYNEV